MADALTAGGALGGAGGSAPTGRAPVVLHVYKDYAPVLGGIERHIEQLARHQAAIGLDARVLVTGPGRRVRRERRDGVTVIRCPRLGTLASAPISPALAAEIARQRPDLTHLHLPYPVGAAAWMALGRRPMVASYHSDIVRQRRLGRLWAPFQRRVLARADRVLAGSPPYAESSPVLRAVRDKVSVVPYGVDPARLRGGDRAAGLARHGPGPWLVFVGRLRYYKGLDVLVDALPALAGVGLLVAGRGAEEEALKARARARGVAERIRWLGDVPDEELPELLATGDLFVLPSTYRSEAYGIAMAEAMAAGLPALSTDLGTGTSWVNLDGETGRVVPPGDPGALAAAVLDLLGDDERRARMGRAAARRAEVHLSEAAMNRRVLEVYEEVAGLRPAAAETVVAPSLAPSHALPDAPSLEKEP